MLHSAKHHSRRTDAAGGYNARPRRCCAVNPRAGSRGGRASRRGTILPALLAAILVTLMALALVVDRYWLTHVSVEMRRTADATAHAGALALLSDVRLQTDVSNESLRALVEQAAQHVAQINPAGGTPLELKPGADGDIQLGSMYRHATTGETQFLTSSQLATTVIVTATRTRERGNPVGLFLAPLFGTKTGDVTTRSQADLDGHLVAFRPTDDYTIPAVPLAILSRDPTGTLPHSFDAVVSQRTGTDQYRYSATDRQVVSEPDGVPELILFWPKPDSGPTSLVGVDPTTAATLAAARQAKKLRENVRLVDIGNGFVSADVTRQIAHGFRYGDLVAWQGELPLPATPLLTSGTTFPESEVVQAFEAQRGTCRIVLLYEPLPSDLATGAPGAESTTRAVRCVGVAAGRIMAIRTTPEGDREFVFQPGCLTTNSAVTSADRPGQASTNNAEPNKYVFHLRLGS